MPSSPTECARVSAPRTIAGSTLAAGGGGSAFRWQPSRQTAGPTRIRSLQCVAQGPVTGQNLHEPGAEGEEARIPFVRREVVFRQGSCDKNPEPLRVRSATR